MKNFIRNAIKIIQYFFGCVLFVCSFFPNTGSVEPAEISLFWRRLSFHNFTVCTFIVVIYSLARLTSEYSAFENINFTIEFLASYIELSVRTLKFFTSFKSLNKTFKIATRISTSSVPITSGGSTGGRILGIDPPPQIDKKSYFVMDVFFFACLSK